MRDDIRARPTLRLLQELDDGWRDACQRRHVQEGRWRSLHPFALLDHPVLAKAVEQFGSDPANDINKGTIACSGDLRLLKVRAGQWRAGVWTDPSTDVRWIVAAGLAKGGHEDADDFYERLKGTPEPALRELLPTDQDYRLLRRETKTAVVIAWRLDLQRLVIQMLSEAMTTGASARTAVPHPSTADTMAKVCVTWSACHEPDYDYEDLVVELFELAQPGSRLTELMRNQILAALAPPSQDWQIGGGIYSTLEEHGHAEQRLAALRRACQNEEVVEPQMGQRAHRAHKRDILVKSINGEALRALCGTYFVPTQDPGTVPACPECHEIWAQVEKSLH